MSLAKRHRRAMPSEIPLIAKTERIIAIPSNNSPNFSYSNNVIRFQIPSIAGKIISPFRIPRLTFTTVISAPSQEATPPSLSPYIGLESLIYQIQVSSTLKGVVLHTCRFYSRAVQTTEIDNYGWEEINRGSLANEAGCCYDYEMAASGTGQKALAQAVVPLFTNVLDAPDMVGLDLSVLGGLSIEIQLNSNTSLFIDSRNGGWTYQINDVKLHYDLLTLMAPSTPSAQKEILFRCIESRADNIQSASEYKSLSVNNSNVESLTVDAVPSAVQNSYSGDSFQNSKLVDNATVTDGGAGNYNKADYTIVQGFVGLQEFRESVNGASVPIQQILNIPNLQAPAFTTSSIGLSNVLREDYKGSVKAGSYNHPRTLKNLYTYDNVRFIQGVGTSVNPNPYLAVTAITGAYDNGLIPIPKFSMGMLMKSGGCTLPESVISYKFNSSVANDQPYTIFNHLGLIKRILVGAGGELSILN